MNAASLKQALKDWIDRTTSHGLPNIFRFTHWTIRVIWTLAYLTSFVVCCYFIAKCFVEYGKYATTVSIAYVREAPTDFPAVTLCNLNPFDESAQVNLLLPEIYDGANCTFEKSLSGFMVISNWMQCMNQTSAIQTIEIMLDTLRSIFLNNNYTTDQLIQLGHRYEDMKWSENFNSFDIPSNYTQFRHPSYGNCYTFNDGSDGPIWKTSEVGNGFGLSLELLVGACKQKSRTENFF
jgi:hypothetical protein